MRKIVAELAEGLVVGLCMGVILVVLGLDLEIWQFAVIGGGAIISAGLGGFVRKAIATGEYFYNYEWSYQHGGHSIKVKASKSEELYVDGQLVDKKTGISIGKVELKGQLSTGETITAVISGEKLGKAISSDKYLRCEVFVDGKLLETAGE